MAAEKLSQSVKAAKKIRRKPKKSKRAVELPKVERPKERPIIFATSPFKCTCNTKVICKHEKLSQYGKKELDKFVIRK